MTSHLRDLVPHPSIARPVLALAVAVWVLVGSVVYLTIEERHTQRRVANIEYFVDSCLGPAKDTQTCSELYDSLVSGLTPAQLRRLSARLAAASSAR